MKGSTFLQLFLLFDVFLMGAIAATALRHAYAHFRPNEHDLEKSHTANQNNHLPPSVRQKMLADAQANFQAVLDNAAKDLEKDLANTADEIKKHIGKLGEEAETKEMDHYRTTVVALQDKTKDDITTIDKELAAQKAELKAKFAEDMAAEKQHLLQQIDTKLADAVGSFLIETLQHNVDLGAQSAYLIATLEEHKADLAKEVSDDTA